jgi:molybdopterin synthase sulfur carrier subunit
MPMPILKIPAPLRTYFDGQMEVSVIGTTVGQAVDDMLARFPALKPHLTDGAGQLRSFVNLFLGEENIKDLQGLDTPLGPDDILRLVPSVAGG